MERIAGLGLDADVVRERYPRLIYARGHGYGVRGPDAGLPGYDASAYFARGGVADLLTPPGREHPINQRGAMGDRNGAMALAFGIAAVMMAGGIYFLEASFAAKGFYAMSALMLVHTTVSLSKSLRDDQEAGRMINKIEEARTRAPCHPPLRTPPPRKEYQP